MWIDAESHRAWKVIVSAVKANLVFTAGLVAMFRHRKMIGRVAILFRILNIMIGVLIAALSMTHGLKAVALANSREFWVKFQPSYFCPRARRGKEPQKGIAGDLVRMFQSTMPQFLFSLNPFGSSFTSMSMLNMTWHCVATFDVVDSIPCHTQTSSRICGQ